MDTTSPILLNILNSMTIIFVTELRCPAPRNKQNLLNEMAQILNRSLNISLITI